MEVSKKKYHASCLYDWKESLNILQGLTSCWSLRSAAYENNWLKKISIGHPAREIDIVYFEGW